MTPGSDPLPTVAGTNRKYFASHNFILESFVVDAGCWNKCRQILVFLSFGKVAFCYTARHIPELMQHDRNLTIQCISDKRQV